MTKITDDGELEYSEDKRKNDEPPKRGCLELIQPTPIIVALIALFGVIFSAVYQVPSDESGETQPLLIAIILAFNSNNSTEQSSTPEVPEVAAATITPVIPTDIIVSATSRTQPSQTPTVVIVTSTHPLQTPSQFPNEVVAVDSTDDEGIRYICNEPGVYQITYDSGAYTVPGYGSRTVILIFPDDMIRWGYSRDGRRCEYGSQPCPQESYYFIGHYGGPEFQTQFEILSVDPQQASFAVQCDNYVDLVGMAFRGTYDRNSGTVYLKIQRVQ